MNLRSLRLLLEHTQCIAEWFIVGERLYYSANKQTNIKTLSRRCSLFMKCFFRLESGADWMPSFRTYRSGPLCEAEYSGTIVNKLALVNRRHCETAGHLFCMQLFQDLRPLLLHALCTILTARFLQAYRNHTPRPLLQITAISSISSPEGSAGWCEWSPPWEI